MTFSSHRLLLRSQRVLGGATGKVCCVCGCSCSPSQEKCKIPTTPVPLKAPRRTARSFVFAAPTFFLKPVWWVWSCIQHTLSHTRCLRFGPRMDFTNQRIKCPATSILLRPKDEGCNVWISGFMVSHCQERASTEKESTGFPWRQ